MLSKLQTIGGIQGQKILMISVVLFTQNTDEHYGKFTAAQVGSKLASVL